MFNRTPRIVRKTKSQTLATEKKSTEKIKNKKKNQTIKQANENEAVAATTPATTEKMTKKRVVRTSIERPKITQDDDVEKQGPSTVGSIRKPLTDAAKKKHIDEDKESIKRTVVDATVAKEPRKGLRKDKNGNVIPGDDNNGAEKGKRKRMDQFEETELEATATRSGGRMAKRVALMKISNSLK